MEFTQAARLVLQDAIVVRRRLEDELDTTQWRLHWVLAVVLLRAVGHVLSKVDGKGDKRVRKVADSLFENWKKDDDHRIFHQFIELERNSIIKEYETKMTEGPVPVAVQLLGEDGNTRVEQFFIDENIYRPLNGGYYGGEDGRTLIDEAIEWWVKQLDEVDHRSLSMPSEK